MIAGRASLIQQRTRIASTSIRFLKYILHKYLIIKPFKGVIVEDIVGHNNLALEIGNF